MTEKVYGSVKAYNDTRIYVKPSGIFTGGVYLGVDTQSIWLTENETKKLWKLLQEASKAGYVDG